MNLEEITPIREVSQKSLIVRVEDSLIDFIRGQGLSPGDLLPSQANLAKAIGVSSSTLRETLSRLEERGILRVEHGKGTFINRDINQPDLQIDVNLSISQMIKEQGMVPGTSEISVAMEVLPEIFQGYFKSTEENAKFLCLRRVRTANNAPFAYSAAYLSHKFNKNAESLSGYYGSLYEYIRNQTDENIAETEAMIYSVKANKFIAEKINIAPASPLLAIRQIHMNEKGDHLIVSTESFSHSYLRLKVKIVHK